MKDEKLMKTIKLIKKIKNDSKKFRKNHKELNDMEIARKHLNDTMNIDTSFMKTINNGKNIENNLELLNDEDIQDPKDKDDYDLNDSDAYNSNYHFYNQRYKLLGLPKKLEYNKEFNFDIFQDYETIQADITKFFYYVLIAVLVIVLIYGLIKLRKFMKK